MNRSTTQKGGIKMFCLLVMFVYGVNIYRCIQLNDCFQINPFNIKTALGNVFFLQTIYVPIFTSNVALWSLANEFWYYSIFPLIIIPITLKQHWFIRALLIGIIVSIAYWIMPSIIQLFPLWLLGAGIRLLHLPVQLKKTGTFPIYYTLLFISVYYSNTTNTLTSYYLVGLTYSLLILYHQQNTGISFLKLNNPAGFFADFSFSLYAIHLPILFLLLSIFRILTQYHEKISKAGFYEWGMYLILFFVIMFFAYLFYLISEKHTYKLRKWVYRFLKVKS